MSDDTLGVAMRKRARSLLVGVICLIAVLVGSGAAGPVRAVEPPFRAPLAGSPGPGTWFVGQWYGNTVWAHDNPYPTGQGLHFGIDFNAPCGTPVLAIGDGVVLAVDGPYGAAPHNVVIQHGEDLFSLYGHLLERATLQVGQQVTAGEPIAQVGDPAGHCDLDPHLHLEIRRAGMKATINPVPLLRIDWNRATAGIRRNGTTFERDLDQPDRWMTILDQPDVVFGGARLNDYPRGWP